MIENIKSLVEETTMNFAVEGKLDKRGDLYKFKD